MRALVEERSRGGEHADEAPTGRRADGADALRSTAYSLT
jgi:hypothetical protein